MTRNTSARTLARRLRSAVLCCAVASIALVGCAAQPSSSAARTVVVGIAAPFGVLDPAGPLSSGSSTVGAQVFGRLMTSATGRNAVEPELAATAAFTTPSEFTVTLRPGERFANGDRLSASDVKFSLDRLTKIGAPGSAASLLGNVAGIETPDDRTVVFHLKSANDQTFARVLSTVAGTVVDEQVFATGTLTSSGIIVAKKAFSGPYAIDSYAVRLITLSVNPRWSGGDAAVSSIALKSYGDSRNVVLDLQDGLLDVATVGLTSTDVTAAHTGSGVRLVQQPAPEIRALVFDPAAMPFGSAQPDANPGRAMAVRAAVADLLDRASLASTVSEATTVPLFSYVPSNVFAASPVMKSAYGDGAGAPDPKKVAQLFSDANITTPLPIAIGYVDDATSASEFDLLQAQLEASGQFTVKGIVAGAGASGATVIAPGAFVRAWSPPIADPDGYLRQAVAWSAPGDPSLIDALAAERGGTPLTARTAAVDSLQTSLATQAMVLPLVQRLNIAAVGADVVGVRWDGAVPLFAALRKR